MAEGHPSLYQLNTRIVLQERGVELGRRATLDDLSDQYLGEIADLGFTWVWLLGVWQTGRASREVSRCSDRMRAGFAGVLPDLRDEDIVGSPFAVASWSVHQDFGGDAALARLRERLERFGVRLLLDFVPNHVALDHRWAETHPHFFIAGTEDDLAREPQNFVRLSAGRRSRILAHGRDPYFDGWTDTLQLNYRHPALRMAQLDVLAAVAGRCDGVRCDMAMLLQPQVFQRTWGDRALPGDGSPPDDSPFWPAAIAAVRGRWPEFLFMAEVYWDLEWELQQAGFDYTYDKRLYDRLREGTAERVRGHLGADQDFQRRSVRFLENHDEPRAAAVFDADAQRAAAVVTYLVPGLRFFHEGQFEGRKVHVSMHLGRRPREVPDPSLRRFYGRLLAVLRRREVHAGRWRLCDRRPAWDGNPTHDQFIAMTWQHDERQLLIVVNYAPNRGQCYVTPQLPRAVGERCSLVDLLGDERYDRDGVGCDGLFVDMPAWGYHVFEVRRR